MVFLPLFFHFKLKTKTVGFVVDMGPNVKQLKGGPAVLRNAVNAVHIHGNTVYSSTELSAFHVLRSDAKSIFAGVVHKSCLHSCSPDMKTDRDISIEEEELRRPLERLQHSWAARRHKVRFSFLQLLSKVPVLTGGTGIKDKSMGKSRCCSSPILLNETRSESQMLNNGKSLLFFSLSFF